MNVLKLKPAWRRMTPMRQTFTKHNGNTTCGAPTTLRGYRTNHVTNTAMPWDTTIPNSFLNTSRSSANFLPWDTSWILRYKQVSIKYPLVWAASANLLVFPLALNVSISLRKDLCCVSLCLFDVILKNPLSDTMYLKKDRCKEQW